MRFIQVVGLTGLLLAAIATPALADSGALPAPAHQAEADARDPTPTGDEGSAQPWRMPRIAIKGKPAPELREEDPIGDYQQPRWTANRRFPNTRIYVVPKGKATVEYWQRVNAPLGDLVNARKIQSYYELELGLGHRLQLDIYLTTEQKGWKGDFGLKKEKLELRYALADWGQLWGNPTLYLEWSRVRGDTDFCEGKILLGDQLAPSWHWGLNLAFETSLGGEWTHEFVLSGGISKTLTDQGLSVGLEGKTGVLDKRGSRFKDFVEQAHLVGPSVAFYPVPAMHVLATVLAGVQGEAGHGYEGAFESWLIGGWTF